MQDDKNLNHKYKKNKKCRTHIYTINNVFESAYFFFPSVFKVFA